jgi:hypothetical protein
VAVVQVVVFTLMVAVAVVAVYAAQLQQLVAVGL